MLRNISWSWRRTQWIQINIKIQQDPEEPPNIQLNIKLHSLTGRQREDITCRNNHQAIRHPCPEFDNRTSSSEYSRFINFPQFCLLIQFFILVIFHKITICIHIDCLITLTVQQNLFLFLSWELKYFRCSKNSVYFYICLKTRVSVFAVTKCDYLLSSLHGTPPVNTRPMISWTR